MAASVEITPQGDHEYLIDLAGDGEEIEVWMRVDPQILAGLELGDVDEGTVVRRTVDFLLEYQDVPDFPRVVELEDVLASYSEFVARLRAA